MNGGDSASSYRHWRNGAPHTGNKGEKMGGGYETSGNGNFPPPPIFSPWSHTEVRTIPPRTQ
ncbi:MAG: hypothetical protein IKN99_08695 [Bacteroidales bacterium]|nr:hypothetical protein [Bacteroidales bacterium]